MDCLMDRRGRSTLDDVTRAARQRLSKSPYAMVRRVSCEYDGGMLRLHGCLPTFYHKQLAQEAVADLDGVLQVVNQTEVVAPVP